MTTPSTQVINTCTAQVMERAIFSACESNNFPLSPADVQYAYAAWSARVFFLTAYSPEYNRALVLAVHDNLEKLGWKF